MTNLIRWNPFESTLLPPAGLFGRDLFSWLRPDGGLSVEWNPRCDMTEKDGEIVVHAELPGVEAKDIEVTTTERSLTIRGEKRAEKKDEKDGRTYSERFFGSFERTLALPVGVDRDRISATIKDGVLEVRIPKPAAAKPEPKKIEVKSA